MRILALDAALGACSAGMVADGSLLASLTADGSDRLPALVRDVLAEAGPAFDAVAVTIGPGSFTGIRAALALAHGIALARNLEPLGITVREALAALSARPLWAAIDTRRGRVFLDRGGPIETLRLDALPTPDGPIAIAGDAAASVAARLAARGADVQLLPARRPNPLGIALAATHVPPRPAQPLYVDPPEARPGPAGRPAPA